MNIKLHLYIIATENITGDLDLVGKLPWGCDAGAEIYR